MPVPAGGDGLNDLYTDLATVKAAVTASSKDDDRDELIEQAIRAACRQIDHLTGRRFYADVAVSTRTFPVVGQSHYLDGDQVVLVDDIATEDGLLVASGRTGAWTALSGWETGPDNALAYGSPITQLRASAGWLPSTGRIQVTARWGWPAVPDGITQAALLLASRLYKRRQSPQGVLGNAEWGPVRVSRTDPDVDALIAPFVIPVIA